MKNSYYTEPTFDLETVRQQLTDSEWELVAPCFKTGGQLRASKPDPKANLGQSSYIWRMIVFDVSPNPKHQCMPVTADWDIRPPAYENFPGDHNYQKRLALTRDILDPIADKVCKCLPPERRAGLIRWGRALGMLP
ncbi:MAG: hypothetical protein LUQ37_10035 [Methanoregulaceae archaeon]|jgi:hypothetical protein|nr:hypothetical protein [Methanoregulaceae archaeon]